MTPLIEKFVLHFGEMGSRWGINRTVGQMYALLYVSPEPLNADDLVRELHISRSNVSMGLKELQGWRLLKRASRTGDRRDYFTAPDDVWEIFNVLAEERQRREIDPTLSMLREALMESVGSDVDRHAQSRMRQMHDLIDEITTWFGEIRQLSPSTLRRLMKMGTKIKSVLRKL